jgi:hypothetical protein
LSSLVLDLLVLQAVVVERESAIPGVVSSSVLTDPQGLLAGSKPRAVWDIEQGASSPNRETVVALGKSLGMGCEAFLQPPVDSRPVGRDTPRKQAKVAQPEEQPKERRGRRKPT